MLQLQRYAIILSAFAGVLCLLVLRDNTYKLGITLAVVFVFLMASMGFAYWVFLMPSGRVFARKYDKKTLQISSTLEQRKIAKSKAYEYGIGGAILGFIVSLPSVWAALQMLQIQGGGNFVISYVIGIVVVVFVGYLSGFSQGLTQFSIACPSCHHKFILSPVGGHCPACGIGIYIDERGDCKRKKS